MNTKINYLYRDSSNYKTWNSIVIRGEMTDAGFDRIRNTLDGDGTFIPEQIGLPLIRDWAFDPDLDHPYAELLDYALTSESITENLSVEDVVAKFEQTNGVWDPSSVPSPTGSYL